MHKFLKCAMENFLFICFLQTPPALWAFQPKPNCHFIVLFLQTAKHSSGLLFTQTQLDFWNFIRTKSTVLDSNLQKKKVKNSIFQLNIFVFCNFCSFIFLSHWSALNPGTRCLNVADELLTRGQCFLLLVLLPQS